MLSGPHSSCRCSPAAGGRGGLRRAALGTFQPQATRLLAPVRAYTCYVGAGQQHGAHKRCFLYNSSGNSSSLHRHASPNSVRRPALADGSISGSMQGHPDAAVDAAAEEEEEVVWTLQDFLQEAESDAAQQQPVHQTSSAAGTDSASDIISSTSTKQRRGLAYQQAKEEEWKQQQRAKNVARRQQAQQLQRHPQHQASGVNSSGSSQAGSALQSAYDTSRWFVRKDWRQGVPANLDYLVVTPHNAAEKHARYMVRRLLGGHNKGRMLLLFHDHRGATKALAILQAATHFLQRKHKCTLLCQVGFTVHDPLRMRLLVTLWPYAGVLHPKPLPESEPNASASSSDSSSSSTSTYSSCSGETVQEQAGSEAQSSSATNASSSSSSSSSSRPTKQRRGWMSSCLEGTVPEPQTLPHCCRHLPPLAVPKAVSHHVTLNASRYSEPPHLANLICSALALKGRCRVCSAGGIAALHALTAVALAELILMRSSSSNGGDEGEVMPQGLAMHIRAVQRSEQLPAGSPTDFHVVRYYELTLLLCKKVGIRGELIPAMCVFPVRRNTQQRRQQQQGEQQQRLHQQGRRQQRQLLQADDADDEGEGYLW